MVVDVVFGESGDEEVAVIVALLFLSACRLMLIELPQWFLPSASLNRSCPLCPWTLQPL